MNSETTSEQCPICGSGQLQTFLELTNMPAQDGVVYPTKQAAVNAPTDNITLAACRRCQYIGNLDFDADNVEFAEYNYAQHHSRRYRQHVDDVVATLVDTYALRNKTLVDIGCGEGYFLNLLCEAGDNRGVGIDPSLAAVDEGRIDSDRLTLIKDFYSSKYSQHRGELVSCRHVIDELAAPREFLQLIVGALSADSDAVLYVELPNATRTFERNLIWNIGYAKRSWFSATSLGALLRICDLDVLSTDTIFDGEYLGIVGRKATGSGSRSPFPEESSERLLEMLDGFDRHFRSEVERWTQRIAQLRQRSETMVIWGAGMRGINFLSRFGDTSVFPGIVDINPNRQGSYLPSSGYFVDKPESLKTFSAKRVLVSNASYEGEIRRQLAEMGVICEVESL